MARRIPASILAKVERLNLPVRPEPHWQSLNDRRLSIGYRNLGNGRCGTWVGRIYDPKTKKKRNKRLGAADDYLEANGKEVFSFAQALAELESWARQREEANLIGNMAVEVAVRQYIDALYKEGRTAAAATAESFARCYVYPPERYARRRLKPEAMKLGGFRLAEVDADLIGDWARQMPVSDASKRRIWATVRAALRAARVRDEAGRVVDRPSPAMIAEWAAAKIVPKRPCAPAPRRPEPWSADELRRLIAACAEPEFKDLVIAAAYTGARYGELISAKVGDYRYDPAEGVMVLEFPKTKSGNPHILPVVVPALAALLDRLTAGEHPDEPIFSKAEGRKWRSGDQVRRMRQAEAAAGIPHAGFHHLRRSAASLLAASGVPLVAISKMLNHRLSDITSVYATGRLADLAEQLRQHAPDLEATVLPMRR